MCWVIPPASPATTLAWRILSSTVVLPWSTWPMIVMTGGARLLVLLVVAVVEQRLETDLLLLAGLDEHDVGAELEGEQLHLLVGEVHRRRDHLAVVEQEADDVGGRAVQLGAELLGRHAALDDDGALGHGRVAARVVGVLRLQLFTVATTTAAAACGVVVGAGRTDGRDRHLAGHRDRRRDADHQGHRRDVGRRGRRSRRDVGRRVAGRRDRRSGAGPLGPPLVVRAAGGRALPGGGGIGRPDGDSGRPGGGGMGRPVGDIGRAGAPAGAPAGTGAGRATGAASARRRARPGTSIGRCSPGVGRPEEITRSAETGRGAGLCRAAADAARARRRRGRGGRRRGAASGSRRRARRLARRRRLPARPVPAGDLDRRLGRRSARPRRAASTAAGVARRSAGGVVDGDRLGGSTGRRLLGGSAARRSAGLGGGLLGGGLLGRLLLRLGLLGLLVAGQPVTDRRAGGPCRSTPR